MKNENLKNLLKTITPEEATLIEKYRAAQARKKANNSVSSLDELIPERVGQNENSMTDYKKAVNVIKEFAVKVKKNGGSFYRKMRKTLLQQGFKSKTYSVKERSMTDKKGYVYIHFNGAKPYVTCYPGVCQNTAKTFEDDCGTWIMSELDTYPVLRIKASAYMESFEYSLPSILEAKESHLCDHYFGGMTYIEAELVGLEVTYDLYTYGLYPPTKYPKYKESLVRTGHYRIHKDKVVPIDRIMAEFMKEFSDELKRTRREVKGLLGFCDESLKDLKEKTATKWWSKDKEE